MVSTRLTLAALLGLLAGPVLAQDVQYELINNSGLTLMEFYTSPASEGSWGDDILGANVLATGSTGTVTIADGSEVCKFDLRFVFEDGSEMTDTVDVCTTTSYELVP